MVVRNHELVEQHTSKIYILCGINEEMVIMVYYKYNTIDYKYGGYQQISKIDFRGSHVEDSCMEKRQTA